MSPNLKTFLDAARKWPGRTVTLRLVFKGRGKMPVGQRAEVKAAFAQNGDEINGVMYDRKTGRFTNTNDAIAI